MARSKNMQKLTEQTRARWPGVTIYGIGDEDHQQSPSGHNEDDTPGSRPEQEDPDNKPEHRAIDVMLGPAFSRVQAWEYVTALVTHPANRARLLYVIFDGWIWRARNGWKRETKTGDPHRDHPHISGTWQDDENTASWVLDNQPAPAPQPSEEDDMVKIIFAPGRGWARVGVTDWVDIDDNDAVLTPEEQTKATANAKVWGNSVELTATEWDLFRSTYPSA